MDLQELYEAAGRPRKELASILGVSVRVVNYWLRGQRRPTPRHFRRLSLAITARALERLRLLPDLTATERGIFMHGRMGPKVWQKIRDNPYTPGRILDFLRVNNLIPRQERERVRRIGEEEYEEPVEEEREGSMLAIMAWNSMVTGYGELPVETPLGRMSLLEFIRRRRIRCDSNTVVTFYYVDTPSGGIMTRIIGVE